MVYNGFQFNQDHWETALNPPQIPRLDHGGGEWAQMELGVCLPQDKTLEIRDVVIKS